MDDLVAFLAARLDEDEAAARAASDATETDSWVLGAVADMPYRAFREYITRFDPARVRREVAAKRAIVRRCEQQAGKEFDNAMEEDRTWVLWPVLFDLAAVYSDHPDYRDPDYRAEWEP